LEAYYDMELKWRILQQNNEINEIPVDREGGFDDGLLCFLASFYSVEKLDEICENHGFVLNENFEDRYYEKDIERKREIEESDSYVKKIDTLQKADSCYQEALVLKHFLWKELKRFENSETISENNENRLFSNEQLANAIEELKNGDPLTSCISFITDYVLEHRNENRWRQDEILESLLSLQGREYDNSANKANYLALELKLTYKLTASFSDVHSLWGIALELKLLYVFEKKSEYTKIKNGDRYERYSLIESIFSLGNRVNEKMMEYELKCIQSIRNLSLENLLAKREVHRLFAFISKNIDDCLPDLTGKGCYAILNYSGNKYFTLSGGDIQPNIENLCRALQSGGYSYVLSNDEVRFYFPDMNSYITRGDAIAYMNDNLKYNPSYKQDFGPFSCCERKLVTVFNYRNEKSRISVKYQPCLSCDRVLNQLKAVRVIPLCEKESKEQKQKRLDSEKKRDVTRVNTAEMISNWKSTP